MPRISRARPNDPLLYTLPLPLEAEYYPIGFPVRLATNAKAILDAADWMWSRFPKLFDRGAMRIKVTVIGDARPSGALPPAPPVLRGQEHLFSIVGDSGNFAAADLNCGFGHICLTPDVAADREYVRYHFLEPLAYVLLAARHVAFVHAACAALDRTAVLLCGASGSGKTCLAYGCARRGWTFLAGDAVAVVGDGGHRVVGRPFEIRFRHTARRLFPELGKFPAMLRPSGKTDIEVDPSRLNVPSAVEGNANCLVFLDRAAAPAKPAFRPVSRENARRELEEAICFGDESVRRRHAQTLDRLAQLPRVRLRYSDLDLAESALRTFVSREL